MKNSIFVWLLILCLPCGAMALDKPTAAEADKVVQYYFNAKDESAILMDHKLCTKIAEDGPMKNQCMADIPGNIVTKGQEVYYWLNFLIPYNQTADFLLSFERNQRIRKTIDFSMTGAFRFRTWRKIPTDKPGKWTINIIQEIGDTDLELGTLDYTVAAK
jgi:hypothetical protein